MRPKKYENKTPFMRFLHKNTGWLILLCGLITLAGWIYSNQVEADFYHSWTCPMLWNYQDGGATYKGVLFEDLDESKQSEYMAFLNAECDPSQFEKP